MKSMPLLAMAFFGLIHAQTYAPVTDDPLDANSHIIGSSSSPATLFPYTLSPDDPAIVGNGSFALMTSIWTTSLTVVQSTSSSILSLLSVSWTRGEGPEAKDAAPWGVCAVAMPGLFETLGIQPSTGNGTTCQALGMTRRCVEWLTGHTLGDFDDYGIEDGSAKGNVTAACAGLAHVKIPPFCFQGREDGEEGIATKFQGYTKLNPRNNTAFLVGTDKDDQARAKALARVWPVVLVQFAGNESQMSVMACPLAGAAQDKSGDSSTNSSSGSNGGKTDSSQDKPKKNAAHALTLTVAQMLLPLAGMTFFASFV